MHYTMQIVYDMTHPPFQYWLISKLIRHRKYKLMNQQLSKSKFDLVTRLLPEFGLVMTTPIEIESRLNALIEIFHSLIRDT